jgi:ribosomal protein S18 acetylase RimI-like enzyme
MSNNDDLWDRGDSLSNRRATLISSAVVIKQVDFAIPSHRVGVVEMVNAYASDPLVGGVSLPPTVLAKLGERLAQHPTTIAWLAWEEDRPVGVLVGFLGFSTFAARPLLNLHDLAVVATHRGQGIGGRLLGAAEAHAREQGYCAMTLETRGDNLAAQQLYRRIGFEGAERVEPESCFGFWKKRLD